MIGRAKGDSIPTGAKTFTVSEQDFFNSRQAAG